MKKLDDSMSGIFEEVAKYLMKNEIKIYDKITWNENPQIKTTVKRIEQSRYTKDKMYICENGCQFQENEITKI